MIQPYAFLADQFATPAEQAVLAEQRAVLDQRRAAATAAENSMARQVITHAQAEPVIAAYTHALDQVILTEAGIATRGVTA